MQSDFDKRLNEILEDNIHGSRIITSRASSLFRRLIADEDVSRSEIINRLRIASRKLEKKHSNLSAVRKFCDAIITVLDAAPPRKRLTTWLNKLLDQWNDLYVHQITLAIASHMFPVISQAKTLISHSYSSTVCKVLTHIARKYTGAKIIQSVSFPMKEGVAMAGMLAEQKYKIELINDAGIPAEVESCDVILIGADSVSEKEVINKQGTLSIALAASHFDKPIYVLADSSKLIRTEKVPEIALQNPSELVSIDNKNITVTNKYFDATPLDLFTAIVTEQAAYSPRGMKELLESGTVEKIEDTGFDQEVPE